MVGKETDMQNAVMNFRMLEARLDALVKQRDVVLTKIAEISATIDGLGELDASKEVLFSLGADAYTVGQVIDKKTILVDIGAGILLHKSIDDGKDALNRKKGEFENALNELQSEMKSVSLMMEQLNLEMQKAYSGTA